MTTTIVAKPKPRRRFLKGLGITGIVLGVLLIALLLYSNVPNSFEDMPEVVSAEARERNTLIATSLVVGGIEDSFVDVTPERVFVSYELPDGTAMESARVLQEFVLGAAAQGAPSSARAVIVQTVDGAASLTWEVEMEIVTSFLAGEIEEVELRAAIKETSGSDEAA